MIGPAAILRGRSRQGTLTQSRSTTACRITLRTGIRHTSPSGTAHHQFWRRFMGTNRIIGIVLVVVGAGLAYSGYETSQSVGNQLGSALGGSPSDNVMIRYVAGAASAAVGVFLAK